MNMKQITALIWNSDCTSETCRSLVADIEELEEKSKKVDVLEQTNENLKNCIEALVKLNVHYEKQIAHLEINRQECPGCTISDKADSKAKALYFLFKAITVSETDIIRIALIEDSAIIVYKDGKTKCIEIHSDSITTMLLDVLYNA